MKDVIDFIPPYSAQGDLNIFICERIPSGTIEIEPEKDGNFILAHSETGHNHVIDGSCVRVFEENEFISYLEVKKDSNVIHLRSFDTHKTLRLPEGKYRITRQREYTPEGFRRAQD